MSGRYDSLKKHVTEALSRGSASYLAPSLERLHAQAKLSDAEAQAVIGSAAVAVELMLKALAAGVNPGLVYKDLPLEAKVFFHDPEDFPDSFNWTPYDLDLREFAYDTIPYEDAVRTFYVLFPERKRDLRTYFKALAEVKGLSLTASLGRVRKEELARVVYLALQLAEILRGREKSAYELSERDRNFLKNYDQERARRVKDKLLTARAKAGSLKVDISFNEPEGRLGWETFETRCPVCKNWAFLSGWTDIRCDADGAERLDFTADAFDCDACGLVLEDSEEMKLADMPSQFDRSEDLARWREETDAAGEK